MLRRVLARDRWLAAAALAAVTAAAWGWLLLGAGMAMDPGMDMTAPMAMPWSAGFALLMAAMWVVMMAAMMLPTAAPMVLLVDTIGKSGARTLAFGAGYLAAWSGFAAAATALQYALEQALVMSMAMRTTSTALAGALVLAAGLYQLTPLKQACLRHCRSPLDFVLNRWRQGLRGALAMGLEHGAYCLGCCWVLMALLFVGGVMILWWIAVLTLYVLAEKTLPAAHLLARLAGLGLIAWGGAMLALAMA